jgi:hypothetical protein
MVLSKYPFLAELLENPSSKISYKTPYTSNDVEALSKIQAFCSMIPKIN